MRQAGSSEPGKITKVLWLTESYAEEIEADLQRYYGLDYLEHFRPGGNLGWRRLLVLIERLPPESALSTAIRNSMPAEEVAEQARNADSTRAPWSTAEALLATVIDELRTLGWAYAQAHSDQKLARPKPIPRPGAATRRGRRMSLEDARTLDPRLRALPDEEALEMFRSLHGGDNLWLLIFSSAMSR